MKKATIFISVTILVCGNFVLAGTVEKSGISGANSLEDISMFGHFPESKYTPFGYIANPYHTAVLNRSGVLRSVPPLGFGFWARPLPWPYGGATFGFGLARHCNYLSLIQLSICVDGEILHKLEDFKENDIELYSRYHTKNMMSYDFEVDGLIFRAMYFQVGENSLVCLLEVKNTSDTEKKITVHATNIYGDIYKGYWGCGGIVSLYNEKEDVAVSKFYADGDMFVLGANRKSKSYKATTSDEEWNEWITENDLASKDEYTSLQIRKRQTITEEGKSLGHMISVLSYNYSIGPGETDTITICLSRGLTERGTINRFEKAVVNARSALGKKLLDDKQFYANAPVLTGDWSKAWKNGLIYHLETIRMNIHPPIGIYNHHWDGMQVHTPRTVLGEAAIDSMCLSYADTELAKEVILGTFADAVADNIPCSREDGSLNLVCGNGKEAGTAPIWGLPFHVIHSIYLRNHDDEWIKNLYPHMKSYVEWWLENRTDDEGWFHCACSWESGQDGSKRFLVKGAATSAENVRTVDIEAAMANAIKNMVLFAEIAGKKEDVEYWKKMADKRINRTRDMFVDGRFRDFDARNGKPIVLEDYYSVMMLAPISFGVATQKQMESSKEIFTYFRDNYRFWLEWPSFLFPFSEAAWNAGQRRLLSKILVTSGSGIFPGMDSNKPLYVEPKDAPGLPLEYSYRLPGVAAEWWPYLRKGKNDIWARGCENYGWGATFPTLLIRNIIGFREIDNLKKDQFHIAPALPSAMFEIGRTYGIANLSYRGCKIDVSYKVLDDKKLIVNLKCESQDKIKTLITDEAGKVKAKSKGYDNVAELKFRGDNGGLYTVTIESKLQERIGNVLHKSSNSQKVCCAGE